MKHLSTLFLSLGLLALVLGAILAGFAANEIYFLRPVRGAEEITITISPGASLKAISRTLADQRLVSSPKLFAWYVRWRDLDRSLNHGTFTITRGTSMHRILNLLALEGRAERTITIIEGWRLRDIAVYLEINGISQTDFWKVVGTPLMIANDSVSPTNNFSETFSFIRAKPSQASLEGYLFPDTYRIFADATAEDIVRKMLANFEARVGAISYEDLILASIIEREVVHEDDRRRVADIFLRRLEAGWPLQADSTVNYVTGKQTPALSREDRELDTPFNTYQYPGLPPAPISNPGLVSIKAVQNPLPNDFWYFLTDAAGGVHYARTLEEHNDNKARYLR